MKQTPIARNLYLVVRGPKSEHHKAPYHSIIVCTRRHTAEWESEHTKDGHTVFVNLAPDSPAGNWLLVKYKGYSIDGNSYFTLFDGQCTRELASHKNIDGLLNQAVWWSYDQMPKWFIDKGVRFAEDDFTKRQIAQDFGLCLLPESVSRKHKQRMDKYDQPYWLMKIS